MQPTIPNESLVLGSLFMVFDIELEVIGFDRIYRARFKKSKAEIEARTAPELAEQVHKFAALYERLTGEEP